MLARVEELCQSVEPPALILHGWVGCGMGELWPSRIPGMLPMFSYHIKWDHIPQDKFWTEDMTMIGPTNGEQITIVPPKRWSSSPLKCNFPAHG